MVRVQVARALEIASRIKAVMWEHHVPFIIHTLFFFLILILVFLGNDNNASYDTRCVPQSHISHSN